MITDYFNRQKLISKTSNVKISGGLLGTIENEVIHSKNIFEFYFDDSNRLDVEFMKGWKEISLQKFLDNEVYGVFIAREGSVVPTKADFELVNSLSKIGIYQPIVLIIDMDLKENIKSAYEAYRFLPENEYQQVKCEIISDDSENIGFRSINIEGNALSNLTAVENNLKIYRNSLDGLSSALEKIISAHQSGKFKDDPQFKNLLNKLLNNRIKFSNSDFKQFLESTERESLIYSNVAAAAMTTNYMGRVNIN